MATELEPFDLSVLAPRPWGRRGVPEVWLSAVSRLGSVHGVPRRLTGGLRSVVTDAPQTFRDRVRKGRPDAAWAARTGRALAELVFGVPEIDSLFRRTRGAALDRGRQLLVRVQAGPTAAAAIPWELMADPEVPSPGAPLGFSADVHVVRTARARTYAVRTQPILPPLNVLLVLSNPEAVDTDEIPFDLYEERRALLGELSALTDRGLLTVDVEDQPTVERLRRRIGQRDRGYHLVHFLGHAKATALKLEGDGHQPRWTDADVFTSVLRMCPDLRLVFYAGCSTAINPDQPTTWPEVLSIAERTVRDTAISVVGMQAELPFRTEQVLTRFFYQALVSGQSVAQALKLARSAVRDDDLVGGGLLDWAVPCLFAGASPDQVIDTSAPATAPPPPRARAQLRLDLAEPDREFFARQVELRRVLDTLCRRLSTRVLWIVGPPLSGKTRLVARALDEMEAIDAVLYARVGRLLHAEDGTPHKKGAVGELCDLVVELLMRCGAPKRERDPAWDALEWWDRLIEDLTDTSLVLVLDDIEDLDDADPAEVQRLGAAISRLVQRRTFARVALLSREVREGWLGGRAEAFATVQTVRPLGFLEVWQWIRRNRPSLAQQGFENLARHYATMPSLEQWSQLAKALDDDPLADLDTTVAGIAPPPSAAQPAPATMNGTAPLRLAIAGPYLAGLESEFARAATAFVSTHGGGGRVITDASSDASACIAKLVHTSSPMVDGTTSAPLMRKWLTEIAAESVDIALLDYGSENPDAEEEWMIKGLVSRGTLVIAAGGNRLEPSWPGWYDGVLAVGALEDEKMAPYSYHDAEAGKPDVFAPVALKDTPFGHLLPEWLGPAPRGTSMAAMNAASTALLVWATNRALTAVDIRQILVDSARPVDPSDPRGAQRLDAGQALERARAGVVQDAIESVGQPRERLIAKTGLPPAAVDEALRTLEKDGKVAREGSQFRIMS